MNVVLWIVAVLLAVAFGLTGAMKLVLSRRALAARGLVWVDSFPPVAVKVIGGLEILAAAALVLPPLLGVAPVLAPLAAAGLVLLMAGAAVTHARLGEPLFMGVNAILVLLAAVVVWGRFGPYAF